MVAQAMQRSLPRLAWLCECISSGPALSSSALTSFGLSQAIGYAGGLSVGLCGGSKRGLKSGAASGFDYYDAEQEAGADAGAQRARAAGSAHSNAAAAELTAGTASHIIEFEISVDEAVRRFERYQFETCGAMHAHNLINKKPSTTVQTAYFPFWCFSCVISAEAKGVLGFKDSKTGDVVWRDQEDWHTLCHKQEFTYTDKPYLQVYASYNYERRLGHAPLVPLTNTRMATQRALQPTEATALAAPAAAAAQPSRLLRPEQLGPATRQQPLYCTPVEHKEQHASADSEHTQGQGQQAAGSGDASPQGEGSANQQEPEPQPPNDTHTTNSHTRSHTWDPGLAVVHPPDMTRSVAWQLAYRGLMRDLTIRAERAAVEASGATSARDMHVTLEVHSLSASLLYLPVYIAHYQHGFRYKQGTDTVVTPSTFYAAMSGLKEGGLVAERHVSAFKAQAAAATLTGGCGLFAGSGPTWLFGLDPLLSVSTAEAVTLAVLAAAFASLWANGLPQAARNNITIQQVKAEREFYRQYDARETKTAAALAASMAQAEAEGKPVKPPETGEQADEYMQWLWMDHDWRSWEMDEPWNWDAGRRQRAADQIAARTIARRKERLKYLERLLEDRRKREQEMEQEMHRTARGGRPASGRRYAADGDYAGGSARRGTSAGSEYLRSRRDFLGYYKLLGITETDEVTAELIKAAFKSQALQHHPDRVQGSGGDADEAHVRFQRLQIAYDVLRDPEKRRAYDRGQLMQ